MFNPWQPQHKHSSSVNSLFMARAWFALVLNWRPYQFITCMQMVAWFDCVVLMCWCVEWLSPFSFTTLFIFTITFSTSQSAQQQPTQARTSCMDQIQQHFKPNPATSCIEWRNSLIHKPTNSISSDIIQFPHDSKREIWWEQWRLWCRKVWNLILHSLELWFHTIQLMLPWWCHTCMLCCCVVWHVWLWARRELAKRFSAYRAV